MQKNVALSDSVHQIRKDKEISDIESNHVVELHDQQTKARYVRLLLLGGLVMVASLSVSAIFFLMKDRRSKQMELHYEKSLNDLRRQQVNQLAQVEEKAPETEGYNEERDESPDGENERGTVTEASPFVRIQQERISLYAKRYAVSEWPSFLESRKADIRLNNKLDSERSGKLMQFLDNVFAEIFVAMLDDNKRLTKYDLQYCAMVMLGFNTKVMAYCTQASVHSYHCRHGKMKTLLSDEWYFIVFGKKKS